MTRRTMPTVRAFLLCQEAIVEDGGIYSLIRIFNKILVPGFPQQRVMRLFLSLGDGHGDYEISTRMLDPSGALMWHFTGALQFKDPRFCANCALDVIAQLERAGSYTLELSVDGEPLAVTSLAVQKLGDV